MPTGRGAVATTVPTRRLEGAHMGLHPSRAPHHQRLVWANGDADEMTLTAVEDNRVILARGGEVGGRGAEVGQG